MKFGDGLEIKKKYRRLRLYNGGLLTLEMYLNPWAGSVSLFFRDGSELVVKKGVPVTLIKPERKVSDAQYNAPPPDVGGRELVMK